MDDLFRCVCYLFIWPIFMFFGFVGSLATIIILSSSKFNTTTFYYLKALSVSDLLYLLSAVGYLYEMFFLETSAQVSSITKVDLLVSVHICIVTRLMEMFAVLSHLLRHPAV